MQWVLDLFDKHKVSHPRRHRPLQGVRHRPGLDLLDRPLDAERLCRSRSCHFAHLPVPQDRRQAAHLFREGGLELYTQQDTGRHEATMEAVKWLSDNSFLWTTVGRGASPRKSILERAGLQDRRASLGRCAAPSSTAWRSPRVGEIPVLAGPDFTIYSGGNFLAKTLEGVWAGQTKPEEAMAADRRRSGRRASTQAELSAIARRLLEPAPAAIGRRHASPTADVATGARASGPRAIDRAGYAVRRLLHRPVPPVQHRCRSSSASMSPSPSGASSARRRWVGLDNFTRGAAPTTGSPSPS